MTRKDYEKIAEYMCQSLSHNKEVIANAMSFERDVMMFADGFGAAVAALSRALKSDNERFDTKRFLKACGVYNGKA